MFSERSLRFTFSGSPRGSFSAAGLRAAVSIQATDGILGVMAQVKIWGLSMEQMNNYSTAIPREINATLPDANLIIEAGDLGGTLSQVINGPIFSSNIDLTDAPDSAFVVSVAGIADNATPAAPQSQPGSQNAEDLIAALCPAAGLTLQNTNGAAHGVLRNPNTYGSALKQIDTIARAAGFRWIQNGNTIAICPQGGTIDSTVIDVGPNTNPQMVGYPAYWPLGIVVTSIYNPRVQVGRQMNVVGSIIEKANGLWQITNVQHELTTMMPKGPWFTIATLAGT
jgi:hypothetical protein